MAWGKNGTPNTLSSSGTTIEITDLAGNKFNQWLSHLLDTGGTIRAAWQMNDDASAQHAERWSLNGGADSTQGSTNAWNPASAVAEEWFSVGYLCDISGKEKLQTSFWMRAGTTGAATAPQRFEHVGKFTGGTITKFEGIIAGTGSADTGSNLSALGSELTPASAKTIETGSIYIDTDINGRWWYDGTNWNMQPTFEDNFSTDNWTDASTLIQVNTSTGVLDWDANSSSNQTSYRDIGRELSTSFVLRSKLVIDSISYSSSDSVQIYLGLFDSTSGANVAQDGFAFYIMADTSSSNGLKYRLRVEGAPSVIQNTAGDAQFSRTPSAETLYLELVRNGTTFTINLYSNSGFSTLLESKSATEANVTGLRYLAVKNYLRGGSGGTLNGTWDDVKIYDGVTSV